MIRAEANAIWDLPSQDCSLHSSSTPSVQQTRTRARAVLGRTDSGVGSAASHRGYEARDSWEHCHLRYWAEPPDPSVAALLDRSVAELPDPSDVERVGHPAAVQAATA